MSSHAGARPVATGRDVWSTAAPAQHLASLTSLRIFAAAGVVGIHVAQNFPLFPGALAVFQPGYLGVTFFFVLSGFVLTWNHRDGDRLRSFWARRVARLWPLHLTTTALAVLLALVVGDAIDWWRLPAVLTNTHALVPDPAQYYAFNPVSWTMSCEVFFYALFPLVLAVATRLRRPVLWIGAVVAWMCLLTAVLHVVSPVLGPAVGTGPEAVVDYAVSISPLYRVNEFVTGVLLGVAFRRGVRCPIGAGAAGALTVAALGVFAALDVVAPLPVDVPGIVMVPVFGLLVMAVATSDIEERPSWLRRRVLVELGQSSFALYLIHFLVLMVAVRLVAEGLPANLGAAVVVGVSVPAGLLLHYRLERPAERWVRHRLTGVGDVRLNDQTART